jgi:4-amino-4-deoxy-L-arabinose transferase-like glycosyltransferase
MTHALAFALALAFFFFYGLGSYGLLNNNEGLYASVAQEMLADGSWLVPHASHLPYLEKPPLLYWLLAAAYSLFGENAFAARFIPALSGALICVGLVAFARRAGVNRRAWLAAFLLATSLGYALVSRTVLFDTLNSLFVNGALGCYYLWLSTRRKHYLRAGYALLALSTLSKGMLGPALAALVVLVHYFVAEQKRNFLLRELIELPSLGIFLLVALPWHVAMLVQEPDFFVFYFWNEQILRFLDLRFPRDYYTGPAYYYVPRTLVLLFPWSLFPALLFLRVPRQGDARAGHLRRFLWVWFAAIFAFFSISEAKANYYIVLALPPLAMLLALKIEALAAAGRSAPLRRCALMTAILGASATIVAVLLLFDSSDRFTPLSSEFKIELVLATATFSLLVFTATRLFGRNKIGAALCTFGASSAPLLLALLGALGEVEHSVSARELGEYLHSPRYADARLFVYQDFEKISSLPFYLDRRAVIVDSVSNDLALGKKIVGDNMWFVSASEYQRYRQAYDAPILVTGEYVAQFEDRLGTDWICERRRFGNVLLIENRCPRAAGVDSALSAAPIPPRNDRSAAPRYAGTNALTSASR